MIHTFLTIERVLAQAVMPAPPCVGLPGCGNPVLNVVTDAVIPISATLLLNIIAILALLFVMIGGARYVLAFGRDEELQKAKKSVFWALVGLLVALSSHKIVTIIITETYVGPTCIGSGCTLGGGPLVDFLATVVRILALLLNVTFLLIIVLGGMRMVYARGSEEEVKKGRDMVAYALIGVVIINAAPIVVKAFLKLL